MGDRNKVKVIQTAKDTGDRLSPKADLCLEDAQYENMSVVEVDVRQEFQEIIGFGGAFTEASAFIFAHMEPEKQREIVNAYFHPKEGIGYNFGRIPMNSCDFSLGSYSCDDIAGDVELKYFNIERDKIFIIPLVKEAIKVRGEPLNILISPWSPPGWMKTNRRMTHGGEVKEEYRATWALFYARFIKAYESEGIPIWGLTVQNEPDATQIWESCRFTPEAERDFIRDYLGPILAREGLSNKKIMAWDHNRDLVYERAKVILSDYKAASYVWGLGFHWYSGDQFENLMKTRAAFPDKYLMFTEGCIENGVRLGQWDRGEQYAHNMIGDLIHGANGWIDWNLLLDTNGGPNHVANFCDAPIIVDPVTNHVYYQSSYYYIGHFSKYIQPGARRVQCFSSNKRLATVAFKNPDHSVVTIIFNPSADNCRYQLRINGKSTPINVLSHSIVTYLWNE